MMERDPEIHQKLITLDWFRSCGETQFGSFCFPVVHVSGVAEAIISAKSESWDEARIEALGDLSAYLHCNHFGSYGGHWNKLAKAIEAPVHDEVMPLVHKALEALGAAELSNSVQRDVNMISLWSAYSKRFRRVPGFFGKLLDVYEQGHLPCGWSEDLKLWPKGELMVF